ncbi:MAG: EAL domain-containing protein [Rubrobacteraceae bacterium]
MFSNAPSAVSPSPLPDNEGRGLARTLGMSVTAEGVETREQFDLLRGMGCEVAQGFHMSRPVRARKMASLLESNPRW